MEEQYYISIKEKSFKSEIYDRAIDYAKYKTGELLIKVGKDYVMNIIKQYSERLTIQ